MSRQSVKRPRGDGFPRYDSDSENERDRKKPSFSPERRGGYDTYISTRDNAPKRMGRHIVTASPVDPPGELKIRGISAPPSDPKRESDDDNDNGSPLHPLPRPFGPALECLDSELASLDRFFFFKYRPEAACCMCRIRNQLDIMATASRKLYSAFCDQRDENDDLKDEIGQVKHQTKSAVQEMNLLRDRLEQLRSTLAGSEKDKLVLEKCVGDLTTKMANFKRTATGQIDKLKLEKTALAKQRDEARTETIGARRENEDLRRERDELSRQKDDANREKDKARCETVEARNETIGARRERDEARRENKDLRRQRDEASRANEDLRQERDEARRKNEDLRRARDETRRENEDLRAGKTKMKRSKTEFEDLRRERDEARRENEDLRAGKTKLERLKAERELSLQKLRTEKAGVESSLQILRREKTESEASLQKLVKEKTEHEAHVEKLIRNVSELEMSNRDLRREKTESEASLQKLEREKTDQDTHLKDVESRNECLRSEKQRLEALLEAKNAEIEALRSWTAPAEGGSSFHGLLEAIASPVSSGPAPPAGSVLSGPALFVKDEAWEPPPQSLSMSVPPYTTPMESPAIADAGDYYTDYKYNQLGFGVSSFLNNLMQLDFALKHPAEGGRLHSVVAEFIFNLGGLADTSDVAMSRVEGFWQLCQPWTSEPVAGVALRSGIEEQFVQLCFLIPQLKSPSQSRTWWTAIQLINSLMKADHAATPRAGMAFLAAMASADLAIDLSNLDVKNVALGIALCELCRFLGETFVDLPKPTWNLGNIFGPEVQAAAAASPMGKLGACLAMPDRSTTSALREQLSTVCGDEFCFVSLGEANTASRELGFLSCGDNETFLMLDFVERSLRFMDREFAYSRFDGDRKKHLMVERPDGEVLLDITGVDQDARVFWVKHAEHL